MKAKNILSFLKIIVLATVFLAITTIGFGQRTIKVVDNKIVTACDEDVVMRGVNEMFIWSPTDLRGATTLPEIAKTGANTVRLVWTTEGSVEDLEALIQNCLDNNMIPVPELHDATGDFSRLQDMVDYWLRPEVRAVIQKYKQWIVVNIANEVGSGSETNEQWGAYYLDAVAQMRSAGIDVPLMIDCGSYGSNEENFLAEGQNLLDNDPLHNLIFSVHTYWYEPATDQGKMDRLDSLISRAKAKKLPFIIGEGPQKAASPWGGYCEVDFPYAYLLKRCEEENIGWLSWSWGVVDNGDCGSPNSVFDITTDGIFGNWATTFAEEIMMTDVNSINNTSVIPSSMFSSSCGVSCDPVSITSSASNVCESGSITLEVDAKFNDSKYSIAWFKDNVALENSSSSTKIVDEGGYYRVEVDSLGLCTVFDDSYLRKDIVVEIDGDVVICETNAVTISVEKEVVSYATRWFYDDLEVIDWADETTVEAEDTGKYVVEVYSDYCSEKDSVLVTSNLPPVKDTVVCKNSNESIGVDGDGVYAWYADEQLTDLIDKGNPITVKQTEPKTYFVQDQSGYTGYVGKPDLGESVWNTWDDASKQYKLGFEVFKPITVKSFDVYADKAGAMNVVFYNSSLKETETKSFTVTSGKNTLTINKEFTAGVYYADVKGSSVHLKLNHDEGTNTTSYPYVLKMEDDKLISIDRTSPTYILDKPWYLFFYNWTINVPSAAACKAVPMFVDITENCIPTDILTVNAEDLFVYPNPSTGKVFLSSALEWKVYNVNGLLLDSGEGKEVDLSNSPNGLYLIHTPVKVFKIEKK